MFGFVEYFHANIFNSIQNKGADQLVAKTMVYLQEEI